MRFLLALLLALVLAAPAAASPVIRDAPAMAYSDGRSVAAWADGTGLHVAHDDGSSATWPLTGVDPRDCRLGGVNASDAGFFCGVAVDGSYGNELTLVDLRTGAVHHPLVDPYLRFYTSVEVADSESYDLVALGDRVAEVHEVGIHTEGPDWFRLGSPYGYLDLWRTAPGYIRDLDAPYGVTRMCGPLPRGGATTRVYRAPWMLALRGARVLLRKCGERAERLVGSTWGPTAVLTRTYAAWATDDGYEVAIRMLATGKTYKISTRGLDVASESLPRMAATARRLWLGDDVGHARVVQIG